MVDAITQYLGKTLVRSLVGVLFFILLLIIVDAKNDVRRAEERANRSDEARRKSDLQLAKTERECSDRLNELWSKFYSQDQEIKQMQKMVDRSLKRLKQ